MQRNALPRRIRGWHKCKQMNLYSTLLYKISKALRHGPYVTMGSQFLFTCHPHTNHTCLYSPAARRHCLLAGTHCPYPRRDGQAD